LFGKLTDASFLKHGVQQMFRFKTARFAAALLAVGILGAGAGVAATSWAAADTKDKTCCDLKQGCCEGNRDCCTATKKPGCCEKGMTCCKDNKECCDKAPACCKEGKDCCKESKACCGAKGQAAVSDSSCSNPFALAPCCAASELSL
jgi:hypothetical protein